MRFPLLRDNPQCPFDRHRAAQLVAVNGLAAFGAAHRARVPGRSVGGAAIGHDPGQIRPLGHRDDVIGLPCTTMAAPAQPAIVVDYLLGELVPPGTASRPRMPLPRQSRAIGRVHASRMPHRTLAATTGEPEPPPRTVTPGPARERLYAARPARARTSLAARLRATPLSRAASRRAWPARCSSREAPAPRDRTASHRVWQCGHRSGSSPS